MYEKVVVSNLQVRRKRFDPQFKLSRLARATHIEKTSRKGYSTNWIYKLYTINEVIHDTLPSHRINYLPERYNENFYKKQKHP